MVDVRKDGEYLSEHMPTAIHASLEYINDRMGDISKEPSTFTVQVATVQLLQLL